MEQPVWALPVILNFASNKLCRAWLVLGIMYQMTSKHKVILLAYNLAQKALRILLFHTLRMPIPQIWLPLWPLPHSAPFCSVIGRKDPAGFQLCFFGGKGQGNISKVEVVTSIFLNSINFIGQDCNLYLHSSPQLINY